MFNDLLEHDPYVQQQRALGKAEGLIEGEVQTLQWVLVDNVRRRFPTLVDLAQQKAARTKAPEALREIVGLVSTAPDESTVRSLLTPPATELRNNGM